MAKILVVDDRPGYEADSLRILLVEDNPINQMLAQAILNKLGFAFDCVENGLEALSALRQGTDALVLMDCQMPVMDGYEATRRIRLGEAGSQISIPVIAVTAHVFETDRDKCRQAGMDDYLAKPFSPGELSDMVAKCLPALVATGLKQGISTCVSQGVKF
jgi:CheY-like chemotaxis protein